MFDIQQGYLAIVEEHGFRLPDGYLEFAPQAERIRGALAVRREPTVACNNDLLAGNFIDDGDRIHLIDYEYSGNNDACFELGNIWSECHLDDDQLEHLVTSYYGRRRVDKVARARLWGLMSQYGWTLWASIQEATSDIDFPFWPWGMEKYERAVATFRGPPVWTTSSMTSNADRLHRADDETRTNAHGYGDRAARAGHEVVIIGGGIVGTSVAYHLTRLGWSDVVVVEQGQLSSGTTWHAAGLLGQLRATEGGTRLVQYSAQLYSELEAETGLATGFKRCGGVTVARTEERMVQLRRTAATAEVYDLECELISAGQGQGPVPGARHRGSGRRHLAAR